MQLEPPGHTAIPPDLLQGQRVRLRHWTAEDRAPFAAMMADPRVMQFLPGLMTRAQSDAHVARISGAIDERGWGFWAAEHLPPDGGAPQFMGFIGLNHPLHDLHFNPCVEIGWRLATPFWGQGLASEGARLALRVGFEALDLDEIVGFTSLRNARSRALMERLGMRECPTETFDHPAVPAGNPIMRHCLYRLDRARWTAA
ncbi:GNAT family N-acetyltransferase [uncultured Ramlibacter sp.]|uniref:GNAT family N-acetyltransferase n=1 Tax=uncultured Ramlibacter sp. TaxID=260755 RepID=UPI0026382B82|nr:GNAT family N-acetyltransferase [uncultured Ramlibacter sp.]